MKLLTKAIIQELGKNPIGSHDGKPYPKIIVKFFAPWSNWTWYVTEAEKQDDGDYLFYGLVTGVETELGYFRLSELQSIRGMFGLKIERDLHFDGCVLDMKADRIRPIQAPKPDKLEEPR